MAMMLEWFLFCKIELIVSPWLLSVKRSYSKNFEISRFSIMLEKNLFRTSVFPNSALRIFPFSDKFILSLAIQTVMVLQFFKKVCCYYVFFIKVRIFFFFLLIREADTIVSLFCMQFLLFRCSLLKKIVTQSRPIHDCFWKISCYKWHLITLSMFLLTRCMLN